MRYLIRISDDGPVTLAGCRARSKEREPKSLNRKLKRAVCEVCYTLNYCSLAYSAWACLRIGMSGSASFHRVRKSW